MNLDLTIPIANLVKLSVNLSENAQGDYSVKKCKTIVILCLFSWKWSTKLFWLSDIHFASTGDTVSVW